MHIEVFKRKRRKEPWEERVGLGIYQKEKLAISLSRSEIIFLYSTNSELEMFLGKNNRITTNCWTIIDRKTVELTKKDTPHPKTKEKPQWDDRSGAITIKSNPITAGWVTHKLEIPQKSTHWSEGSEPHVRLPNLGVQEREEEFLENQTLKANGIWLTGLGETETSLLEGTHKVVCASGHRGRSSDHIGDWSRPTCHCWRVSCRGRVAVAHREDKNTGSRSSGNYSLAWALPECTISPTKEHTEGSRVGLPQAKQRTGREPSPTHQQSSGLKFYWALPTRATARDLWDNIKCNNVRIIGVPEGEEREKGPEKIFEEIIVENFPNMGKEMATQVQEVQSPIQDKPKEKHAETHSSQTGKN